MHLIIKTKKIYLTHPPPPLPLLLKYSDRVNRPLSSKIVITFAPFVLFVLYGHRSSKLYIIYIKYVHSYIVIQQKIEI